MGLLSEPLMKEVSLKMKLCLAMSFARSCVLFGVLLVILFSSVQPLNLVRNFKVVQAGVHCLSHLAIFGSHLKIEFSLTKVCFKSNKQCATWCLITRIVSSDCKLTHLSSPSLVPSFSRRHTVLKTTSFWRQIYNWEAWVLTTKPLKRQ